MAFKMRGPSLYKKSALKHTDEHPGPGKEGDKGYHTGHKQASMQKTNVPSKKEIAAISLHKSNLKDYPELYEDSHYDERRANNAKILEKYPNYNWDK
jgi:hypothetical protein